MTINLDMDGTIANLYDVDGWLDSLEQEHTKPYRQATPMLNMRQLGHELCRLQQAGHTINIVSWLSKNGSASYGERVTRTKLRWLKQHLGAVRFDNVFIVAYGTPKYKIASGILFDDEERNRTDWSKIDGNIAYGVENILGILRRI